MTRLRQKASPGAARPMGRISAVQVDVHWLDGARSVATLTIDGVPPAVLMIDGDPFLRFTFVKGGDRPLYQQVKPYRVDAGLLEGC